MQHYGLPTRLLDWTRSPLIALFFAVEGLGRVKPEEDAAIWVLQPYRLNEIYCGEKVTPSVEGDMCRKIVKAAFIAESGSKATVMAAMASETDTRMFVQQGCFTVHSNQTPLNSDPRCNDYLAKITIPSEAIPNLTKEVDICGLRRDDIFPDLGSLALELRNTFPP